MVTVLLVSVLATILVSLAGFLASSGLAFFFLLVLVYGASLLGFGCLVSVFFSTPKVGPTCPSIFFSTPKVGPTCPSVFFSTPKVGPTCPSVLFSTPKIGPT